MVDIWEDLDPIVITSPTYGPISLVGRDVSESGGNRNAKRARPNRNGVKQDWLGHQEDEFKLELYFQNDVEEPDVNSDGLQMWPDRLEQLIRAFKLGELLELQLPWKFGMRVRADSWSRTANAEGMREGEMLSVTLTTDNEDAIDGSIAIQASVRPSLSAEVEQAVFDAEREGMWDGSFEDFTQLAADLEGALAAPGEYVADLEHKGKRVQRACRSIQDSFSRRIDGRDHLLGPAGARLQRRLGEIADAAGRAVGLAEASKPQTREVSYTRERSLSGIAAELGQSYRDLLSLNSDLEDPDVIEPGTPVKVFA